MQTLNILDSQLNNFNSFKVFDSNTIDNSYRRLVLMEQLQTTLELDKLLNIFAMEAAKFISFTGLYFTQKDNSVCIRGSRKGKAERQFELKINNKFIGTLTYAINAPISLSNYKILNDLHQYLLHPIQNAISYKKAMALAMQDSLTGLGNRRAFDQQIKRAMHHATRQHHQVGLMVCDLDKFKLINDTHGHNVGDDILIDFAEALRSSTRDSDSIFRFGGDEFVVIVEDASEDSLNVIETRIQQALAKNSLLSRYNMTCSLGCAFMHRADNEISLFKRADQALYRNKMKMPNPLNIVSNKLI